MEIDNENASDIEHRHATYGNAGNQLIRTNLMTSSRYKQKAPNAELTSFTSPSTPWHTTKTQLPRKESQQNNERHQQQKHTALTKTKQKEHGKLFCTARNWCSDKDNDNDNDSDKSRPTRTVQRRRPTEQLAWLLSTASVSLCTVPLASDRVAQHSLRYVPPERAPLFGFRSLHTRRPTKRKKKTKDKNNCSFWTFFKVLFRFGHLSKFNFNIKVIFGHFSNFYSVLDMFRTFIPFWTFPKV